MDRIKVKDVYFSYGTGGDVLKEINLSFSDESTAIIGQNGAGKTTFVKLLKGLLKPSKGDIYIKDQNTKDTTVAALSGIIGLVFQNPNDQIFKNRVIDEVMFGPLNIGMSYENARKSSMRMLELMELDNKADENPYDLSLAERKLVSIASILAMEPDIVIFDEPTIAQDYLGREKIKNIIRNLRKEGRLIITITHDMDFVAETFERVIVFQQGRVLLDGSPREVYSKNDLLRSAYLEPPHISQLSSMLNFSLSRTVLNVDEFVEYLKSKK